MVKKVIMIVAPEKFRDEECFEPKEIFEKKGIEVRVASKTPGLATGSLGGTVNVNFDYKQIRPENYDAIVFVGGIGAAKFFNDPVALNLAQMFRQARKVVAAICIAPTILANAGILDGKNATSFASESSNLRAKGAFYTGEDVTVDGRIITAKGPQAAKEFGEKIAEALGY